MAPETDITADFDPLFAQELEERGYIADADKITFAEVKGITELDVAGEWNEEAVGYDGELTSLKELEYFESLTDLRCGGNRLTALDVSKNTALTELSCEGNPGNGTVFPVTAWFDNNTVPSSHIFTTGSWEYDGATITVDYRKAE